MESINKFKVAVQNDIARCDEVIYGCARWDITPYPKRLNLIESAYKAMIKLAFFAVAFFAIIATKERFWP